MVINKHDMFTNKYRNVESRSSTNDFDFVSKRAKRQMSGRYFHKRWVVFVIASSETFEYNAIAGNTQARAICGKQQ